MRTGAGFFKQAGTFLFPVSMAFLFLGTFQLWFVLPALVCFLIAELQNPKENSWKLDPWEIAGFLFPVSLLITFAFSKHPYSHLEGLLVWIGYLLVYLACKYMPMDHRLYRTTIRFICGGAILFGGFALFQGLLMPGEMVFFIGPYAFPGPASHVPGGKALTSLFGHPSITGFTCAMAAMFLGSYLIPRFQGMKTPEKLFFILGLIILSAVVLLSFSRGGILFLACGALAGIILTRKKWLILLVVLLGLAALSIPNEKIRSTLRDPLNSRNVPGRVLQYRAGMEIFKENPIFGIGLFNFTSEYSRLYSKEAFYEPVPFLHNTYLSILTESGIAGFILFFLFFGWCLFEAARAAYKRGSPNTLLGPMVFAGLAACSLADTPIYLPTLGTNFMIALGLSMNRKLENILLENDVKQENKPVPQDIKVSVVMPLYNRAPMVRMVLDALTNQTYTNIEYVIVDDGSKDDGADIIEREYPKVKVVRQQNGGCASARNACIRNATGDIVLFVDSDVIVPPDWVETHVRYHIGAKKRIVQGQLIRIVRLEDAGKIPYSAIHYSRSYFDTANVSVARQGLIDCGGFDQVTYKKGWEDLDTGLELLKLGYKPKRLHAEGAVWHYEGTFDSHALQDFFHDRYREGRAGVFFYRKHPSFSSKMMVMAHPFFFWLSRRLFNQEYLKSQAFADKIDALIREGKTEKAVAIARTQAYSFYLQGVEDQIKEDGGLVIRKKPN